MKDQKEALILGGGLAGLTAAVHLSKLGLQVTVIEKNDYPKHKVCGEYISNEILPYFEWLGIDIAKLNATSIKKLQFSTQNGTTINTELPLGGFGISRYALDFHLYKQGVQKWVELPKKRGGIILVRTWDTLSASSGR